MTARAQLTTASYARCSRTLARGEVKRCMQPGPLIGYFIGCPACGFVASYLDEEAGYVEAPPDPTSFPRQLVGIERPPTCYSCRRELHVVVEPGGTFLEARDRAAA